jgi:hypothetical protein
LHGPGANEVKCHERDNDDRKNQEQRQPNHREDCIVPDGSAFLSSALLAHL